LKIKILKKNSQKKFGNKILKKIWKQNPKRILREICEERVQRERVKKQKEGYLGKELWQVD